MRRLVRVGTPMPEEAIHRRPRSAALGRRRRPGGRRLVTTTAGIAATATTTAGIAATTTAGLLERLCGGGRLRRLLDFGQQFRVFKNGTEQVAVLHTCR